MESKESIFFAFISRMKYINRWALMRNTENENICEHSLEVAMIANALGVIKNEKFGGSVNPERIAVIALYHDVSEIITGDLPTPVKYINPEIQNAYKRVELSSKERIVSFLPEELRVYYRKIIFSEEENSEEYMLVKAADRISAYIKCIQELKVGNTEFKNAAESIKESIDMIDLPEVKYFTGTFLKAYSMSLDEIEKFNQNK